MQENIRSFVENVDNLKKQNPADLSSDQDLSIGIMNLISIEEHLFFSGVKTGSKKFFEMIEPIREIRKEMLKKIITEYEGEVWCISKHLLSSSMRLMEVGTKQQSLGNTEEAYNMFEKSYDLYCLFWALNIKDKSIKNDISEKKNEILELAKNKIADNKIFDSCCAIEKDNHIAKNNTKENQDKKAISVTSMSKIRSVISKALDCCRE
jgi:hypothetical protein